MEEYEGVYCIRGVCKLLKIDYFSFIINSLGYARSGLDKVHLVEIVNGKLCYILKPA